MRCCRCPQLLASQRARPAGDVSSCRATGGPVDEGAGRECQPNLSPCRVTGGPVGEGAACGSRRLSILASQTGENAPCWSEHKPGQDPPAQRAGRGGWSPAGWGGKRGLVFFFLSFAGWRMPGNSRQPAKEGKKKKLPHRRAASASQRERERKKGSPGEGFPTCPACAALRRGCLADSVSRRPPGAARNVSSSSHAGASAFSRFDPAKRQSGAAPAVFRVERSARHFARPAVSREKRGHSAWFRPCGAVPPPRLLPLKTAKRTRGCF